MVQDHATTYKHRYDFFHVCITEESHVEDVQFWCRTSCYNVDLSTGHEVKELILNFKTL